MKKLTPIILFLALLDANAIVPSAFSYQCILRDSLGNVIADKEVSVLLSIGSTDFSTDYFAETHKVVTNSDGLLSIEIGRGVFNVALDEFFMSNLGNVLQIKVDPDGGTNYTLKSTAYLQSVPFAFAAKKAYVLNKSITETDPVFSSSVAADITAADIERWNNKPDSLNELQGLSDVVALNDSVNARIRDVFTPISSRDAATKGYVDDKAFEKLVELDHVVEDANAHTYKTVQIGSQVWMAENLYVKELNDGVQLERNDNADKWSTTTNPSYCYNSDNNETFYNYLAVTTNKLCPTGWHVPTVQDWEVMRAYVAMLIYPGLTFSMGQSLAAKSGWESSTFNRTVGNDTTRNNLSGFNGKPTGYRLPYGAYDELIQSAGFWANNGDSPVVYGLFSYQSNLNIYENIDFRYGFSVRCIKD